MPFRIADTFTDSLARLNGEEQKVENNAARAGPLLLYLCRNAPMEPGFVRGRSLGHASGKKRAFKILLKK